MQASAVAPSDAGQQASAVASSDAGVQVSAVALSDAGNPTSTAECLGAGKQAAIATQPACCSVDFAVGQDTDILFYPEPLLQRKDSRSEKLLK